MKRGALRRLSSPRSPGDPPARSRRDCNDRHCGRPVVGSAFVLVSAALLCGGLLYGGAASAQLTEEALEKRVKDEGLLSRFRGSYARIGTSIGGGTFISDQNNPYLGQTFTFFPRFNFGDGLSVRAYWVFDCEYTRPDSASGRHCDPSDTRLSVHHNKLWRDPWIGGLVLGNLQMWVPTGYASRHNHTIMNLRASVAYFVILRNKLELSYGFSLQKYLPSERIRGFVGRETDDQGFAICNQRTSGQAGGACGSGGPRNDNWLFVNNLHAAWYFKPTFWLSIDLVVYNYVRFSTPEDSFTDPDKLLVGQSDSTWGIIEAGWQPSDRVILALGISSLQPALTPTNSLRFPFYDFSSPHNNYTKWYLAGTFVY